ncbi:MAG: BTAD domain-containing putative transcriptional regulator [Chloroflexota bacterium]
MLAIHVLGGLTIEKDGEPKRLTARVDEAILVYLMAHPNPIPREKLIDLLWQNSDPKQANNNFRSALSRVRRLAGDYLTVTRQAVGFDHGLPYFYDAAQFENMLNKIMVQADPMQDLANTAVSELIEAIDLYRGEFLAGFEVRGSSPEFEAWRLVEQERLRALASTGLQQLIRHARRQGQWRSGLQFAAQLLQLDPLNETAHTLKMELHLRNRERTAALKQYQRCQQILMDELGIEPLPATQKLGQRLRTATPQISQLPVDPSPLVGRSAEISTLVTMLLAPEKRLVTLTGIGGIGKTRVALATARYFNGRLLHGVIFVSLIGIEQPERLALRLVDALGIDEQLLASGELSPDEVIVNHLRERECLLVLDNYEPLLAHPKATRLVETLLQQAPEVRLLITSRESLQLYEETVILLDGLHVSAPKLFTQHAAQVRGESLPEDQTAQIETLCQLLANVPLAVELAAGQTRTDTVSNITARIEETLDALQTTFRNLPPRQRSLRAAFNYSWELLAPTQQVQLAQLVLFEGDFDDEAASALGVEYDALTSLVTKSLVQAQPKRRFLLHPLIREFANEELRGAERNDTARQFCDHFAKTFTHWSKALGRNLTNEALAAWRLDSANVVQAWRLAINERYALALLRLNTPLGKFHDWRNWYQAAETLYTDAANALVDWREGDGQELEAYGDILLRQAWFIYVQGRIREALGLMSDLEPLLVRGGDAQSIEIWRRAFLQMTLKAGEYGRAQTLANDLLASSDPTRDPESHANRLYDSFHLFTATGDYGRATELIHEAHEIFTELGDTRREQMCRYALGNLARSQGNYVEAIEILRDCLAARSGLGDAKSIANTQATLADALCASGGLDEAQSLAASACDVYAELDDEIGWPYPLNVLGNVARTRGNKATALAYYGQAMQMAVAKDRQMKVIELLLDWLLLMEDELDAAFFFGGLRTILESDLAEYEHRQMAQKHLERRGASLDETAVSLSILLERFEN